MRKKNFKFLPDVEQFFRNKECLYRRSYNNIRNLYKTIEDNYYVKKSTMLFLIFRNK